MSTAQTWAAARVGLTSTVTRRKHRPELHTGGPFLQSAKLIYGVEIKLVATLGAVTGKKPKWGFCGVGGDIYFLFKIWVLVTQICSVCDNLLSCGFMTWVYMYMCHIYLYLCLDLTLNFLNCLVAELAKMSPFVTTDWVELSKNFTVMIALLS